ncbi:hypothetical protein [Amycolatopsis sp. DG1A-15b]|uniref:hypothetical protein n=1 Tax=Amycolatopsis sp. DG1A-15b TaxID=3052846 RepID=UPI00255C11E3|nr:hypothetical protein [Amycolatopsis sp. DG1A-15b]WIX85799.1 hypothetical protein QRY02_31930 [Amycolatopsis sp. DG1A-15b]
MLKKVLAAAALGVAALMVTEAAASAAPAQPPVQTAMRRHISGSSLDGGAKFSGTLTWTSHGSFTANIKLKDAKCDSNAPYFYFLINAGWTSELKGNHRENHEGCDKSIIWQGIEGSNIYGIRSLRLMVCNDRGFFKKDYCRPYEYENSHFH